MRKLKRIINGSDAMKLNSKIKEMAGKIYNLAADDPIGPAEEPWELALSSLANEKKYNHYGNYQGNLELRKYLWDNPEEVLISNGAKSLLYYSLACITDPGDTVLVIGPCWSSYIKICQILQLRVLMYLPFPCDGSWNNDIIQLDKYFNSKISCVILNNPSNPTGVVEGKYFINGLIDLCREFDTWLLADEIYDKFVYEGDFESCLGKDDRVIYINGFSKSCAVPGWRIGYCIAQKELINNMALLQSQIAGPPNTIMQAAALNALPYTKFDIAERNHYKEIRDYLCSINPLFNIYKPYGGFYFYLPVKNEEEICNYLAEHNIIVTPGHEYGINNTIRVSFANTTLKDLKEIEPYLVAIS